MRDDIKKKSFETRAMPHLGDLRLASLWLTKKRPDAEDLVQDSIAKAYGSWCPSLSKASCRVLLFKTLTWLFFSGEQKRPAILSINYRSNIIKNISNARIPAIFEGLARTANRTIVRLPIEVNFAKFLSKLEGFSSKEIAEIFGLKLESDEFSISRGSRLLQIGQFSYSGQG